ncbi:TPA: hypothetical protein N0F65_003870 [Lagenidium giganteum]|uniref:WLGC domain-containing protein n=1 Tax=Lagenidium giganteum TaxID=4803 RepID=A0AAV2ZB54_9STRA|nr:TPA: hypothetical protein N0F65_003870 [Lagenidium giganteum]
MAILDSLVELPNLDDLENLEVLEIVKAFHNLEVLEIEEAFHVMRLPSLTNLRSLTAFNLICRNEMCCNRYINGVCDLSDYQCAPRVGEPAVECLSETMYAENEAVINKAQSYVCAGPVNIHPPDVTTDIVCGGAMYKECRMGNVSGENERARRLQIAREVGPKCNPDVEAWLGCRSLLT